MNDDFTEFLAQLFQEGRILFRRRPVPLSTAPPEAIERLERAYARYRLEVAGAAIAFDAGLACASAEVVRQACWALVCHQERVEELGHRLTLPRAPTTAAHHLSADLVLRYLPQVYRRARAIDPSDALVGLLECLLRQWPLSGVLAGLEEGPTSPLDLGGHEGLMLLYAERLAGSRSRQATPPGPGPWRPAGRPLEYVELVAGASGRGDRRD
jgi:hypothetical protein